MNRRRVLPTALLAGAVVAAGLLLARAAAYHRRSEPEPSATHTVEVRGKGQPPRYYTPDDRAGFWACLAAGLVVGVGGCAAHFWYTAGLRRG